MLRGVSVLLVCVVAAGGSTIAFGESPTADAAATSQLEKRVKRLERRVRALARLQLLDRGPEVSVHKLLVPSSSQSGYYYGTARCLDGEAVGGGIQLPAQSFEGDGALSSYPVTGGWYVFARSFAGRPSFYATCIK